ncbi:hypothetical protein [Paludisphaera borealis]|uniref:Uncharacterized protein n=1 Tax=Paludisphaera borealis TaxID=1387353 RepID=A0A1U7CSK4_9BACT|nr:hypothetical protein [Paludisphaera borealis]APW61888.1 hypothetical protein BSF38_03418 [Paludisphaera borealis]
MTTRGSNGRPISQWKLNLPGGTVTHLSEIPWFRGRAFAYADEDGQINVELGEPSPPFSSYFPSDRSGYGVNGMAFAHDASSRSMGITTPDRTVIHRWSLDYTRKDTICDESGGHGIYSTRWGGFMVPMGLDGIVSYRPEIGGWSRQSKDKLHVRTLGKVFYRMTYVGIADGTELWACAGRSSGFQVISVDQSHEVHVLGFYQYSDGFASDFVSLCGVGDSLRPYAAAMLTSDLKLHLIQDLTKDMNPLVVQVEGIKGVAYSVMRSGDHIVVVTSLGIYVYVNLARTFLNEVNPLEQSRVRVMSKEAIECVIVHDRWLLTLCVDGVFRFDLNQITELGQSTGANAPMISTHESPEVPVELDSQPMNANLLMTRSSQGSVFRNDGGSANQIPARSTRLEYSIAI